MKLPLAILAAVIAFTLISLALSQGPPVDSKGKLVHRFPYTVSLQDANRHHHCGGALVDIRWILTAAQCVSPLMENSLRDDQFIASSLGSGEGGVGEVMYPSKVIIHEKFDGNPHNGFDIALVRLEEDAQIVPAYIAQSTWKNRTGAKLISVGWGSGQSTLVDMQHAVMTTLSLVECNHPLKGWNKKAQSSMLCASGPQAPFCRGEAGTPLIHVGSATNFQTGIPSLDAIVGISSFAEQTCQKNRRPEVFTSVPEFSAWIADNIDSLGEGKLPGSERCISGCEELNKQLMQAASSGDATEIKILLDRGADVDSTKSDGETPLHVAAEKRHTEVIEILLDAGAQVDAQDDEGDTALIEASYYGHADVVGLLLDAGARMDVQSSDWGLTPLMWASHEGNAAVVGVLLDAGAQVDTQNNKGWTALIHASYYGHADVVGLLLDAGASKTIRNDDGDTALDIAQRRDEDAVVALLTSGG